MLQRQEISGIAITASHILVVNGKWKWYNQFVKIQYRKGSLRKQEVIETLEGLLNDIALITEERCDDEIRLWLMAAILRILAGNKLFAEDYGSFLYLKIRNIQRHRLSRHWIARVMRRRKWMFPCFLGVPFLKIRKIIQVQAVALRIQLGVFCPARAVQW